MKYQFSFRRHKLQGALRFPIQSVAGWFPLIFLSIVTMCAPQLLLAQAGQNAVMKDATTPINSPSFFDATRFGLTGNDPCQRILATFIDASFPLTGGTVDARGLISGTNTTLTCSVNPIPSGAKGRLLLSSGTYLAQVPWVIDSHNLNIVGTGASDSAGSNNTIIQACASGQPSCGGVVFPSGKAVIQMGTSSKIVFRSTVKELVVDCQDVPGVSGFQVIGAEEETVFDLVKATGCRVAGFDIGVGDTLVQNGAALSNFEVGYQDNGSGGGQGCPTVTPGAISTISRDSSGLVTVQLTAGSFSPALEVGYEVVISSVSNGSFNGTYRVNTVITNPSPGFTYQQQNANAANSSGGQIALYPVGVRVWQASGSDVRPIINGTISAAKCAARPPIAMELSGGFPFVHNIHTEGFDVGVQIGDLSGTNGATLSNLRLTTLTKTGIVISNQWVPPGTPAALPTGNINIFNLDVTGGTGTPTANSIIDNINVNTLTRAAGNGAVGYYLFGLNGVMTSALPENGLQNAFDINGLTTAIYSGSPSPVFIAAPSGTGTGAVSTSHYLGVQATGPSCLFTTGGGGSPSCSLDAGSTDSVGTIIAKAGTLPGSNGTITLTFNSNLGTNRPSCVFMASDNGTGAWIGSATMKDKTPMVGSDVFSWTNGTTSLTSSKTYWINYFCGGR